MTDSQYNADLERETTDTLFSEENYSEKHITLDDFLTKCNNDYKSS